jgi:ATP-dependent helicase HrpB
MAAFPLHPRYARLLLAADELGCLREAALVAGLAQGRRVLLPVNDKRKESERENALGEAHSDFIAECLAFQWAADHRFNPDACRTIGVHALAARQAAQAASQFLRLAESQGLVPNETPADEVALRRCIFRAFSDHLALREDRGTLRCRMVHHRSGLLRRESLVRDATLLVAAEMEETDVKGGVATLLGMNTAVEANWLEEDFPEDLNRERRVWLDPDQKRVVVREEERFRDLILQTRERGQPSEAEAATLLADEILAGRLNLKAWDAAVDQWIDRLNFAARHLPELGIAVLDDEGRRLLLENICLGAFSYREVRERPVWPTLRTWLSAEQAMAMDRLLPVEIKLPARNRTFRLRYEPEQVVLSAMIQDFYDADPARLRIADRIPITLEMLAPNRRPVQITRDLTAFWSGSYPAIRKELKGRYPKHDWR